jgi:asparagine N-glycosylation enzyme membrane subunit Stt3
LGDVAHRLRLVTSEADARRPLFLAVCRRLDKEIQMTIGTVLLIVLILLLIGALPTWPHSRSWGYRPTGLLGIVLIIVIILLVLGRL